MIGLCSVTFRDQSISIKGIVDMVKESELEVIEWASDSHVPETDLEHAKEVRQLMDDAGLQSNSYGTYYRLGSFNDFEPYIETAQVLGAKTLRVWAGEEGSAETDDATRNNIIEDAERVGELADKADITISLEYHANTLTDTPESAAQLMKEIDLSNVLLYWQPAEDLSVEERIESLPELAQWVTNVHVFNWENPMNRFPLADAGSEWQRYIDIIDKKSPYEHDYLLEFVPGENQEQGFFESAETLKKLVK